MNDQPMSEDYSSPDEDDKPVETPQDYYWHYMNRAAENFLWYLRLMGFIALVLFLISHKHAKATDLDGQWANSPNHEWYEKQQVNPQTRTIYGIVWTSCCNTGDVCQECVIHKFANKPPWADGWYYEKDGKIKPLPGHIVDYVPWTPTGKPVLFLYPYENGPIPKGQPVCLKVPGGSS